jgi:hypothetical protein
MNKALVNLVVITFASLLVGCAVNSKPMPASIEQKSVLSFDTVALDVEGLNRKYGADNVLIVVDIDNTLLTSSVDLGGDIWYQWQTGKLELKPRADEKVSCLLEDSIGLLYELVPMVPTEPQVPAIIKAWQSSNNTVFALTSRAPKYRAATERELYRNGYNLETNALSPKGQPAPVYRETVGREISYMKGIMMTTGLNKGEMLEYILAKTGRDFDAIVFVDDSHKNIVNLYEQYKSKAGVETHLYHYERIEKDREAQYGSALTMEQADKMARDWQTLTNSLNKLFPQRVVTEGCLSPM